ncbi:MAG: hypothetical protein P0S94_01225 [Simkaniaceae bacterium]|nr:hypothetical protein [Simkaniaceae bacterium]
MRYSIDQDQTEHFDKAGTLTLEMPLSDADKAILDPKLPPFNPWTQSGPLRKFIFNRQRAEIASQLFDAPMLRLGYALLTANLHNYNLEKSCCLQGAIGTLTIDLENPDHIIIKNKYAPHNIENLSLIIVYCTETIIFKNNKADPFFNYIKAEGKAYGDHLQADHHPYLIK